MQEEWAELIAKVRAEIAQGRRRDGSRPLPLDSLAARRMQDHRHVLRADEDAKETNRSCTIVAAPMPVRPRLQECLAGVESVARSVSSELNGHRPLKQVDVALNWMHHPRSDGSRRDGHDVRKNDRC